MATRKIVHLLCDAKGCDETYTDGYQQYVQPARQFAAWEQGWRFGSDGDLCPKHAQEYGPGGGTDG